MSIAKETPIPLSGLMVNALLGGQKTMTRRVVRFEPSTGYIRRGRQRWHRDDPDAVRASPYGQPGDLLWVREGWRIIDWRDEPGPDADGDLLIYFEADGTTRWVFTSETTDPEGEVWRRLRMQAQDDREAAGWQFDEFWGWKNEHGLLSELGLADWPGRARSSRFMFRWASRINLRVKDVRVERLQDITEEDAIAEGCQAGTEWGPIEGEEWRDEPKRDWSACEDFAGLWDNINGKKQGRTWADNPRVWVVSFEVVP